MNLLYLFISLLPGVLIIIYIYIRDYKEREPLPTILKATALGGLASVPVFLIGMPGLITLPAFFAVGSQYLALSLLVGFVAEASKVLVFWLMLDRHTDFNEPFDGIVYAVVLSMGFAMVENTSIILSESTMEVALGRMFSAVPAHGIFAVLFGWFAGFSRIKPPKYKPLLHATGFVVAWLYHSAYNYTLLKSEAGTYWVVWMLLLLGGVVVSMLLIRNLFKQSNLHKANLP